MREILFRVWDQNEEIMLYSDEPSDQFIWFIEPNGIRIHELDGCSGGQDLRNFVVMQFTGLLDKNGKKIFEGDIVISKEKTVFVVEYWNEWASFAIVKNGHGYNLTDFDELKITGNIHDKEES